MNEETVDKKEKQAFWEGVTLGSILPMTTATVASELGDPCLGGILAGFISAGALLVARGHIIALRHRGPERTTRTRRPGPT